MMNNEPENSAELPTAEIPEAEMPSDAVEQPLAQGVAEDMPQAVPEVTNEDIVGATSIELVDEVSEANLLTEAQAPIAEPSSTESPSAEPLLDPEMAEPGAAVATGALPTPEVAPETAEEIDDNFIKEKVAAAKVAKKKAPAKPRKPTKRERLKLPDLGDGSGYEPPESAVVDPNSGLVAVDETEEAFWYAVHCYSSYENKVKHSLEQRIETMGMAGRILEIVVPTEEEIEVRDGKRKTVERRVFPGYVLVRMKMSEESWFVVRNTPGVTRFIGMGNRPQPLTQQEVNQVLRRMEAEAPKIRVSFKSGQRVRITDGPFADFPGLVDKIDTERAKVTVLVSFFGRETPVELDFLQVEKM